MATNVYMEALSPTMEEGRVVKWHKREGDPVKTGETLAEVETDKAVMDLVARADGVLRQVAVAEGETVPVGSVVAVIAAPGEAVGAARAAAAAGAATAAPQPLPTAPATSVAPADATRVKASPLARRMAKETGVDLKLVTGTGPGGRVTKRDLETAG
ncbi:MAG TPA: biotin/lipoyl-containing protein, partial [Gemmatimonadales bacterium]